MGNREAAGQNTAASEGRPSFDGSETVDDLTRLLLNRTAPDEFAQVSAVAELMTQAHEGQQRTGGNPYAVHPLRVALSTQWVADTRSEWRQRRQDLTVVALAHDVLEDCPGWERRLASVLTPDQWRVVELLSKTVRGVKRPNYWTEIRGDVTARALKVEDRIDNLRFGDLTAPDRQQRYWRETIDVVLPLAEGTHAEELLRRWAETPEQLDLLGRVWCTEGHCGG